MKKKYIIEERKPVEQIIYIYDTFDWRLLHGNLCLMLYGNVLTLRELYRNTPVMTEKTEKTAKTLHLPPDSLLLKEIEPLIKTRALIQHTASKVHTRNIQLYTKKKQEAFEMEIKKIIPGGPDTEQLPDNIFLVTWHTKLKNIITLTGIKKDTWHGKQRKQDIFFHILALHMIKPGDYPVKPGVKLLSHMTTETACRIILITLLHSMSRNEEGIKNDIDFEFLHDFRVAIRRTRSLLSRLKKVFPASELKPFRAGFSYFAKLTNEPRDIDVFLLRINDFKKLLPAGIKDDLLFFHIHLKERHKILYKKLSDAFESEQYKTLINDWNRFLNTPVKPENKPPKAEKSIFKTARRVIGKQYRKVIESGLLIREDSPPVILHALRIRCKELKYLLEFFLSLFPKTIMKKVLAQVKALQDNLGSYQDIQVQQKLLSCFLDETTRHNHSNTEEAISFLINFLKNEDDRLRKDFYSIFNQFNSKKVKAYFIILCGRYAVFPD
ncbi:MAG: CHAD domain-containing protein [Spirochaetales bacterium]|nr:CHAD domain-containing protein [Spirochaetales bacterium]